MGASKGDVVSASVGRGLTAEEARAERIAAMEARLARLESFVARWACIVGAPRTEFTRNAEALVASGFDPRGGA